MWQYEKKLEYPVNIKNPNPALAKVIITQFGGLNCICYYIFQVNSNFILTNIIHPIFMKQPSVLKYTEGFHFQETAKQRFLFYSF